jgi:hypothetical protein
MMTSKLLQLMSEPLPSIGLQKKLYYRPTKKEVKELYTIINKEVFNNQLPSAKVEVKSHCRGYWGICIAQGFNPKRKTSQCIIRLSDRWFCKQWLINTLAHEMVHQHQWDIYSKERDKQGKEPIMSHGPSFYKFRKKLSKHGIVLKKSSGMNRWFKYQKLSKC